MEKIIGTVPGKCRKKREKARLTLNNNPEISWHMKKSRRTYNGVHLNKKSNTQDVVEQALTIYPGKVGDEYFMTKGHFHANMNRGEYYWGVEGEGRLIMMDQNRRVWSERMFPGSLHYIPGGVAHRVANIGYSVLSFAACWPSDAGHDYQVILENGFSASLQCVNGNPQLIEI